MWFWVNLENKKNKNYTSKIFPSSILKVNIQIIQIIYLSLE